MRWGPPAPLLARAIEARGGPIAHVERESRARVLTGMVGEWGWHVAFDPPDRMHFILRTGGEDQHWVTDGSTASTWLGNAVVTSTPVADSDALWLVRWLAVVNLDSLADRRFFRVRELRRDELSLPHAAGIEATSVRPPVARYRVYFDDRLRLVTAEGPMHVGGVADGRLQARFEDFRRSGGFLLPFHIHYRLDDEPFADELVLEQRALASSPSD